MVSHYVRGNSYWGYTPFWDSNNLQLHSASSLSYFTPCTDNSFEPANKRSIKLTLLPLPPLCLAVINICLEGLFSVPLLTYGSNQAINQKQIGVNNLFIVKQNCCWKIVVRIMQGVCSIVSINLYAEEKEHFLFAYDAPMTFLIRFCLTIKNLEHGCTMCRTKPTKCKISAP